MHSSSKGWLRWISTGWLDFWDQAHLLQSLQPLGQCISQLPCSLLLLLGKPIMLQRVAVAAAESSLAPPAGAARKKILPVKLQLLCLWTWLRSSRDYHCMPGLACLGVFNRPLLLVPVHFCVQILQVSPPERRVRAHSTLSLQPQSLHCILQTLPHCKSTIVAPLLLPVKIRYRWELPELRRLSLQVDCFRLQCEQGEQLLRNCCIGLHSFAPVPVPHLLKLAVLHFIHVQLQDRPMLWCIAMHWQHYDLILQHCFLDAEDCKLPFFRRRAKVRSHLHHGRLHEHDVCLHVLPLQNS